jgi:hypothetical protein
VQDPHACGRDGRHFSTIVRLVERAAGVEVKG